MHEDVKQVALQVEKIGTPCLDTRISLIPTAMFIGSGLENDICTQQ